MLLTVECTAEIAAVHSRHSGYFDIIVEEDGLTLEAVISSFVKDQIAEHVPAA